MRNMKIEVDTNRLTINPNRKNNPTAEPHLIITKLKKINLHSLNIK